MLKHVSGGSGCQCGLAPEVGGRHASKAMDRNVSGGFVLTFSLGSRSIFCDLKVILSFRCSNLGLISTLRFNTSRSRRLRPNRYLFLVARTVIHSCDLLKKAESSKLSAVRHRSLR
ncbi:hypothetical protein AXF42_Ash000526 [Apostasia shenzhenica]|uniref:Uncharacterized protein n=1 Tax=Apostasia shenzhenica TaxID=1088818 RepID=A0A2I0AGK8_9ASPA|nr:hypothetical protein AXF42_Ash000526 [Apostasia shenzhenica]